MRALVASVTALLVAAAGHLPAHGQAAATAPASTGLLPGSRILHAFDFEERKLGNFESIPMYWAKLEGRGYPAYSAGAFDRLPGGVARSGETSFRLKTAGGSVGYRYNPPPEKKIRIYPDADYYVLAFTRSRHLKHARADLAAWIADESGARVPGTQVHSQPYVTSDSEPDAWRVLYLYLPGPPPVAPGREYSLVLQVGLLQPQQLTASADPGSTNSLGRFAIYQQDIQGEVWFDDITVFQLPRVSIDVPQTVVGKMFAGGQKVDLNLVVSDLGPPPSPTTPAASYRPLEVRLRIADATGLVFANERFSAATTPERAWVHHYSRPALPAGKYTATLEVMDATGNGLIARRQIEFLCLAPGAAGRPAPEFGMGIDGGDASDRGLSLADVPTVAKHAGVGWVQLPAWRREMAEDALTRRDTTLEGILTTLQRQNVRAIGTFAAIPPALRTRLAAAPATAPAPRPSLPALPRPVDGESILALLNSDAAVWRPYVSFTVTRFANRIDYWELGTPSQPFSGDPVAFGPEVSEPFSRLYDKAFREMSTLLDARQLVIPWNALIEFDPGQFKGAVLDLLLPSVIKPAQIPAYLESFRPNAAAGQAAAGTDKSLPLFAHVVPLDAGADRGERLADFAQRIVMARTANPRAILYDPEAGGRRADELFLVYRTLVRALGNARYEGELSLEPGVRAFLFNEGGSGTLVLWNEKAGSAEMALDLPLGATAQRTDLLGNRESVRVDGSTGLARVIVGATPIIVEGLDPRPLKLKASFALGTSVLPAGAGSVATEVMLTNPYAEMLSGTLRIMPPRGWAADPAIVRLNVAPGQTMKQAVTIRYPFTENAGVARVEGRLTVEGGSTGAERVMALSFPMAVTSDRVEVDGFAQMLENGDVVVQQMVTNISDRPLDAQAYALLPGFPRQQRYVSALPPGQTAIKRFTFSSGSFVPEKGGVGGLAGIAEALKGQAATVGLRQSDGKTLLSRRVPLE